MKYLRADSKRLKVIEREILPDPLKFERRYARHFICNFREINYKFERRRLHGKTRGAVILVSWRLCLTSSTKTRRHCFSSFLALSVNLYGGQCIFGSHLGRFPGLFYQRRESWRGAAEFRVEAGGSDLGRGTAAGGKEVIPVELACADDPCGQAIAWGRRNGRVTARSDASSRASTATRRGWMP
jgi:hypothetical protein